ncbi:OmpA family protein [Streptomyces scopuliridis]|uniref:OmpA family protein n=1 Tax=Streptomyces scopuliridis TaxID=452529 RepID=A0ACD4ZKK3_9ACTN|nr:OmpA family protein [Streptomyces scopuliridis]WSB98832.1 OmpA family protein [Streptomyces scopuliridis]WSC07464.1 OmpA family protein [Streptomyces scopuliridis]
MIRRQLLTAALALLALGASSGCGAFESPRQQPCAWLDRTHSGDTGTSSDRGGAHTAILIDRSSSTRAGKAASERGRVPNWAATLLASPDLPLSGLDGDLSVSGFDGTRSTVDWGVNRAALPPMTGNETLKKDKRLARGACLEKRLTRLSAEAPRTDRTDVLGALAAAGEQLGGVGGRRRIVVATDGLTNTGCVDLRSAGFEGAAEIKETVEYCREAGELPDLAGVEVSLLGIGRAAEGAAPSSSQTAWLVTLWARLCDATGASGCDTRASARTHETANPDTTARIRIEPAVTYPAPSEQRAGRVTTLSLPNSVLFATDRAELSPAALSELAKAARRIKELDSSSVTVAGHTDSRGSERRGEQLSLARAEAVREVLVDHGVSVGAAKGYSDRRPRCAPEFTKGVPDYKAMACNRRVEITVTVRN